MYAASSDALIVTVIRSLFPLLLHKLSSLNRGAVLLSAELLGKLATSPENLSMLENAPNDMYRYAYHCLPVCLPVCLSLLAPHALSAVDA